MFIANSWPVPVIGAMSTASRTQSVGLGIAVTGRVGQHGENFGRRSRDGAGDDEDVRGHSLSFGP